MRRIRAFRPSRRRSAGLALLAVLAVLVVTACTSDPKTPASDGTTQAVGGPFTSCPAPVTASPVPPGQKLLPDLSLPCLAGGNPVALRSLGQPAVLNLWASWCDACRLELPEFQHLADVSTGQLLVLGVVTTDVSDDAAAFARGVGVSFPSVFDSSGLVLRTVPPELLPATMFVDASGAVRYVDHSGALTYDELVDLVHDHLGLSVGV